MSKITLSEDKLKGIIRKCVNEAINDNVNKQGLAQKLLDYAYQIEQIIQYMTERRNGRNFLEDWIIDEEWFNNLKDSVFEMEFFAKKHIN